MNAPGTIQAACPQCGHSAYRLRTAQRTLHDLSDPITGGPRELHLTYSQHRCGRCNHYFNADMSDLAMPNAHYTHRVVATAVRMVVEDGLPYSPASWHLWRDRRVFVPIYQQDLQQFLLCLRPDIPHILKLMSQNVLYLNIRGFSRYFQPQCPADTSLTTMSHSENSEGR